MTRVFAATGRTARGLFNACTSVLLAGAFLAVGVEGTQTAVANGDTRTLSFYHTHSKERLTVTFKKNGRYDADALKKLNYFLRDWRNQKQTNMDPRLFDVVWEVQKDAGSRAPIQIISSYRSPETNEGLRSRTSGVAKNSQHTLGKAMDIHMPDVNMSKVREAGLRLQRGGVGFYPTSGLPFVHLDVGNVRHWPRMTRQQLVRLFPDGRTVHLPSDGKPLKNYALAMADIRKNGASVRGQPAVAVAQAEQPRMGKNFLTKFISGGEDDEETTTPAAAPAAPPPAAPASNVEIAQVAQVVPVPVARPAAAVAQAPQMAAAYAPQDMPPVPGMIWRSGPAGTEMAQPATTPVEAAPVQAVDVAMPMPRPSATTPAAAVASQVAAASVPVPPIRPDTGVIAASLAPTAGLGDERALALRMLGGRDAPATEDAPSQDAIGHILSAHDAFAAREAAGTQVAAPHVASLPEPDAAAFSPHRTARDRDIALSHPNLHQTALIGRPSGIVPLSFGGNPSLGMRSDAFSGSSIAVLRTLNVGPQRTAQLMPRN